MAETVSIAEFSAALTDLLEKEMLNADETLDEVIHRRALQYKGKLNLRSPRDTGAYAKGWRVKTAQRNHERVRVIYNAAKPWLTYILEYGTSHQEAQRHIRPALEETMDEIIEELVNRL